MRSLRWARGPVVCPGSSPEEAERDSLSATANTDDLYQLGNEILLKVFFF